MNIDFKINPSHGHNSNLSCMQESNWKFELEIIYSNVNNKIVFNYDQAVELKKKIDKCMSSFWKMKSDWRQASWQDETLNDLI